jgi:hypothetical protein
MRRSLAAAFALLALPALAQSGAPAYPQLSGEVDLRSIGLGTYEAPNRRQQGTDVFLRGEVAAGLYLSPTLSLQGVVHIEPIGEVQPNGGVTGFRYQAAYLENLFLDWRARDDIRLFAGKISAPFGYGHHDFPGVLAQVRAHEVYLIREQLGAGIAWTFLSDPDLGTHDLTFAAFTRDTTALSETAFTRKRLGSGDFERFRRASREEGGPGNTGRIDNFAAALDGDRIAALPGFTYHLAVLSRGAGRDGTTREWGYAAGGQQEIHWGGPWRSLVFAEHVEFRAAGGNPLVEDPDTGELLTSRGTRRFSTAGIRTSHGPWRATAVWQRDQFKRTVESPGTARWIELTAGRDIGWGLGVDVGWQHAREPGGEAGGRVNSQAILGMLRWRTEL